MSEQAPGRLDLVRRFINTVSFERGQDPLHGPDGLADWCSAEGYDCGAQGSADLDRLRAFREAVREIALANAGHGDREASWRALEPFAASVRLQMEIAADGRPVLSAEGKGTDRAIGVMLGIIYDAVRAGEWSRFKACRADDCLWAFYDRSKNGSGAWCSMAVCGNRLKARRRRARSSAASKAAAP